MPEQFGTHYILAQGQGKDNEPMHNHQWELFIDRFPVTLWAKSVTPPKTNLSQGKVHHYNEEVNYLMKPSTDTVRVELYDMINPAVCRNLEDWWKEHYDSSTGRMGLASKYKRAMRIVNFDRDGGEHRNWDCMGACMLHNPMPSDMDYENHEISRLTLEISIDRYILNHGSGGGSVGSGDSALA